MATAERCIEDKLATIAGFVAFCRGRALPAAPLEVFYEISNVCNLKCAMCAEFSALNPYRFQILRARDRGLIEPGAFDDHVLSLLRGALLVRCSGFGESTIHPRFRDIIQWVSAHGAMVHFTTNGQLLDSDLADFLVEQRVYRIMVSCSGSTREAYEQVYLGGRFETLLAGLDRIAAARRREGTRYPVVEINSLGFRHHVETFDRFVALMADHGADIVHLKQLNAYDTVPELYEHVSIPRPWVEGEVLQRAIDIGASRGIVVNLSQYISHAVGSQRDYRRAMERLRAAAADRLEYSGFGENGIETFARFPRTPKPAADATRRDPPVIHATDARDEIRALLGIAELPEAGSGEALFHCMEPFKTAYVARNGGVRPCCFSGADHPLPGSLQDEDGLAIWRGAGFAAIREGILHGQYPRHICQRCLRDRIGPGDHHAFTLVQDYLDWYEERFGEDLSLRLEAMAPDAIRVLQDSPGAAIVRRFQDQAPEPEPEMPPHTPRRLRILLAAGEQIECIDEGIAGLLKGWFERIDDSGRAQGWIWSPAFPDVRLPVRVWDRAGTRLGEGLANRSRGDLSAAGIGDGRHGFAIRLPPRPGGWRKEDLIVTLGERPDRLRIAS